jgi:hypothetical protein
MSQPADGGRARASGQEASKGADGPDRQRPVPLKSPQSLERLRERVQAAARQLERLRKENAALAERIRALETRRAVDLEGTVVAFDEDPEVLRRKIEGFVSAIDAYLSKEREKL